MESAPILTRLLLMTLGQMLRLSAAKDPDKTAVVCGEQIVSYRALDEATDALAAWLLQQGLRPAERSRRLGRSGTLPR